MKHPVKEMFNTTQQYILKKLRSLQQKDDELQNSITELNTNFNNIVPYTIADLGTFEGNIDAVGIGDGWISRDNSVVWCTNKTLGTRPIDSTGCWFSLYTLKGGYGIINQIALVYYGKNPLQFRMWVNDGWSDWLSVK